MRAAVGLRVVRGPHWELSDQRGDGGEGFVGTVVEVGGTKGSKLAENKVWVQWDSGIRRDHRAGQYGKYYDLYVFDSSPAGVVHATCTCDVCSNFPIRGMRWRCLECWNYDLCTRCYMADKHDKHHKFERIDNNHSEGVQVGKRLGAKKIQAKGVFAGARVVRGFDWNRNNQDGGKGKEGVVLKETEHEGVPHSGAVVSWDCGNRDNYRLGYQGKVDLKCVTPGVWGHYYKDHLQRLGEVTQRRKGTSKTGKVKTSQNEILQETRKLQYQKNSKAETTSEIKPETETETKPQRTGTGLASNEVIGLKPGLLVKVMNDEEIVKNIQESCGLMWSAEIAECVGKVGEIKSVRPNGVVELSMNGTSGTRAVLFNEALLTTDTATVDLEEEQESRGIDLETIRSLVQSGLCET